MCLNCNLSQSEHMFSCRLHAYTRSSTILKAIVFYFNQISAAFSDTDSGKNDSLLFPATHQVVLFWYFEQQSFMVMIIRQEDVQVALVTQIKGAESGP